MTSSMYTEVCFSVEPLELSHYNSLQIIYSFTNFEIVKQNIHKKYRTELDNTPITSLKLYNSLSYVLQIWYY